TDGSRVNYTYSCSGGLLKVTSYGKPTVTRPIPIAPITAQRYYCGNFVFGADSLSYVNFPGGYFDSNGSPFYRHTDWQESVTMVTNSSGQIEQHTGYYPYGEPWAEPDGQPYLFSGKERMRDNALNEYDFSARRYVPALALWTTPDPIVHVQLNPYSYCAGNPIRFVDPSGKDWYRTTDDKVVWTSCQSQDELYHNGIDGLYLGVAHVEFDGYRNEKLGSKNGKIGYIDGDGAITADVTVYGPGGEDDIYSMVGYTMTSDAKAFGAIDEGLYKANYIYPGKRGKLPSNWVINNGGNVRMLDGKTNPYAPKQIDDKTGEGYKNGIYLHSTNQDGFAGDKVSVGCLLLAPKDFKKFNNIMKGVKAFTIQVTRCVATVVKDPNSPNGVVINFTLKKD
ncbi:MAG: RHS repeat-associated core domain-containing protein, partial [Muribaculaceae bacterium]|nr:RHS repeat-associated core domain-containing protein [Muribaculaceae bacterium]